MKRMLLLMIISLMFVSTLSFAADMKPMVWKTYGFNFSVPYAMARNAVADPKYYSANDGSMYLFIYPWKDLKVTAKKMGEIAIKKIESWGWVDSVGKTGEARKLNWNGFKGSQIFGTIITNKSVAVKYTVIGIIDPGSANNYFAIIYWNSKKSIDSSYYAKAAEILKTFKMKKK
jgi:hypothetical protein